VAGGSASNSLSQVKIWRQSDGALLRAIDFPSSFALSPDGSQLAVSAGMQVRVSQVLDGKSISQFSVVSSVGPVVYAPGGKSVVLLGNGEPVLARYRVSDGARESAYGNLPGAKSVFNSGSKAAVSPDGSLLAIALNASLGQSFRPPTIIVYDAVSGAVVWQGPIDEKGERAVLAFSPDSRFLVAGVYVSGISPILRVYRARARVPIAEVPSRYYYDLAFSPDGSYLATASSSEVTFWRTADWQQETPAIPVSALSLAVAPSGNRVLVGGWDGVIRQFCK
jgi:WD40 repeat protein